MAVCYNLQRMIEKRGAFGYLAGLRRRFQAGLYSKRRFRYLAAQAYLIAGRPWRALALLQGLDLQYHPTRQLPPAADLLTRAVYLAEDLQRPACSLTMIVKNEESNICEVLDSADELADEIIICDTGSDDATAGMALRYGVSLIVHPWNGDFSAARNRAIEAAAGNWILWLDADDRLEPQSARRIAEIAHKTAAECCLMRIVNQVTVGGSNEFLQARLFPRRADVRFERSIHEQIMPSIKRAGIPFSRHDEIRIIHTGYDNPAIHRSKAQRNRKMIEEELCLSPADPSLLLSLGDACAITGDNNAAARAYKAAIACEGSFSLNPDIFVQAHFFTAVVSHRTGDNGTAKKYLYRCLYADPTRIEAFVLLGSILKGEGDAVNAARMYLRALKIVPPVRTTATDNGKMQMLAISDLCGLLFKWRRFADARDILLDGVKLFPKAVAFHTMLGQAYLDLNKPVEAVRSFMNAISLAPMTSAQPYHGVARIYDMLGDSEKSQLFLELADECRVK